MIADFLTANLRRRAIHGQPLVADRALSDYRIYAANFEKLRSSDQLQAIPPYRLFHELCAKNSSKPTAIFSRPRSNLHVSALSTDFSVLCFKDEFFDARAGEEGVIETSILYWQYLVGKALQEEPFRRNVWIQRAMDELDQLFSAISPQVLVFSTDCHYPERLMALVAKSRNIPIVTIQNGVFSGCFEPSINDGEASDYFIAWSNYMKQLLVRGGYQQPDQIHISGYPYPLKDLPPVGNDAKGSRTVVFLGQPFEFFQPAQAEAKRRIVGMVMDACREATMSFAYRPHPGESLETLAEVVPPKLILPKTQPLNEVFAGYGAFVGLTSSALIEAGLYGRIAIQVYDEVFQFENLDEVGACHGCSSTSESIAKILQQFKCGALSPLPVSPDYLPASTNVEQTFTNIFRSIVDQHAAIQRPKRMDLKIQCLVAAEAKTETKFEPTLKPKLKPLEGASPFRGRLFAQLDLDEASALRTRIENAEPGTEISLAGDLATYSLSYLSALAELEATIQIQPPPAIAEDCVPWLNRLKAAFGHLGEKKVRFLYPVEELSPCLLEDPLVVYCSLLYTKLKEVLPAEGTLEGTISSDCLTMLERSYEFVMNSLCRRLADPELESARIITTKGDRYALDSLSEELERITGAKIWRLRNRLLRLIGR